MAFLYLLSCADAGINGPDVLTKETTQQRIRTAKLARLAACGRNADIQVLFINDSLETARFNGPYYAVADVKICTDQIFSTPCNSEVTECKLSAKSAWKGSFLQGAF